MFCKKREKTVFSHVFRDILNKVRKKCEKTFFELLAWRPRKSVRKSVFFSRFFEALSTKFAKNDKKNSVFWFFCTSSTKKRNYCFFHVFRGTLYKVRKKCEKKACFRSSFLHDVPTKSVRKQCFFPVFRDTLYKVRKKSKKKIFFELFARRPTKSVRKQCFFTFFETLFTKFAKKSEKTAFFWAFCTTSLNKCEKTVIFSRFSRHFVQSSQKIRKNSVF